MHFISFVLTYNLWLLRLRQRANIFFREGHPRRYTVTLKMREKVTNVSLKLHREIWEYREAMNVTT